MRAFAPRTTGGGVSLGSPGPARPLGSDAQVTGPAGTEEQALRQHRGLGAAASAEFIQCLHTGSTLCVPGLFHVPGHRAPSDLPSECWSVHRRALRVSPGGLAYGPHLSCSTSVPWEGVPFGCEQSPRESVSPSLPGSRPQLLGPWTPGNPPFGSVRRALLLVPSADCPERRLWPSPGEQAQPPSSSL